MEATAGKAQSTQNSHKYIAEEHKSIAYANISNILFLISVILQDWETNVVQIEAQAQHPCQMREFHTE